MNIDYKKYLNRCGKQHFVVYLHRIIKLKYIKVKNLVIIIYKKP